MTGLKRWFRVVLLGIGCAFFVYLLLHLGIERIYRLLLEVGWSFVLVAATYGSYLLVRAFAYWKCVTAIGQCSYRDIVRFRVSGEAIQFLTSTGPFLAQPAQMWFLRRHGLDAKNAVASTISEYLIYTLTSAGFGIVCLAYVLGKSKLSGAVSISAWTILSVMSLFVFASVFAIIRRIYLVGALIKWARKLSVIQAHLSFNDQDVRDTEDLLLVTLRDRPWLLLSILIIETAAQTLLVLEVFLVLRATHEFRSVLDPLLIEGATKFTGLVFFFVPGQIGAAEGVYALVFKALGLQASAGFALALTRRLRSLLFAGIGLAITPHFKGVS